MSLLDLFKKKQPIVPGYFPISTDMHSHILPGIDDGSPDVETSIELVKGLMQLGIQRSIATPHIISDLYRNTPETIRNALKILQDELAAQQINFSVTAAAEYMLDPYFFEILESGERLLTLKENIILTEFSFGYQPDNPKKMSFGIITQGYIPILAHPERYAYFHGDYKAYHLLQDMGFLLQVNLLSLTGYYGSSVAKAAKYIIKNGLATYTGTDLHHARHMAALQDHRSQEIFNEAFLGSTWNDDLVI